jgi:hypothetical protein
VIDQSALRAISTSGPTGRNIGGLRSSESHLAFNTLGIMTAGA